jgi:hypothetical protein
MSKENKYPKLRSVKAADVLRPKSYRVIYREEKEAVLVLARGAASKAVKMILAARYYREISHLSTAYWLDKRRLESYCLDFMYQIYAGWDTTPAPPSLIYVEVDDVCAHHSHS